MRGNATPAKDQLPVEISVPTTEKKKGVIGTSYTYYVIKTKAFGKDYTESRTFEEFQTFHAELQAAMTFALPPLPQVNWSEQFSTVSSATIEDRRGKLESLMKAIVIQREIAGDEQERLWKFVGLPNACSCAARFLASTKRREHLKSLVSLPEDVESLLPLKHPAVGSALLGMISCYLAGDEIGGLDKASEGSLVCEVLQRLFRADQVGAAATEEQAEGVIYDTRQAFIAEQGLALLIDFAVKAHQKEAQAVRGALAIGKSLSEARDDERSSSEAVSSALLTLASADPEGWPRRLKSFLENGGMRRLASAVAADSALDETEGNASQQGSLEEDYFSSSGKSSRHLHRMVAQLLFRGCDDIVLQVFASGEFAEERKTLLNGLFMSSDTCAKMMLGLILSRLVITQGYAEYSTAEAGLTALCADLWPRSADLKKIGMKELFDEEVMWKKLCQLLSVQNAIARGYVLLTLAKAISPSPERVLATEGLHSDLLGLLGPDTDLTVRNLAARTLLEAYGEPAKPPVSTAVLNGVSEALREATEDRLAQTAQEIANLAGRLDVDRQRRLALENLHTQSLQGAVEAMSGFGEQADAWRNALAKTQGTVAATGSLHEKCEQQVVQLQQGVQERHQRAAVLSGSVAEIDKLRDNLWQEEQFYAEKQDELSQHEENLKAMGERRMAATLTVAQLHEEAHKLEGEADEARRLASPSGGYPQQDSESAGQPPVAPQLDENARYEAEQRAADCEERRQDLFQRIAEERQRAAHLDDELQHASEPLPILQATVADHRTRVEASETILNTAQGKIQADFGALFDEWTKSFTAERHTGSDMQQTEESLKASGDAFGEERSQRQLLREKVQSLLGRLQDLDNHLASMEGWDAAH